MALNTAGLALGAAAINTGITQPLNPDQNMYLGYTGTVTYMGDRAANVVLSTGNEFSFAFAQLQPLAP